MPFSYAAFSTCVSDRWQLVIGDPHLAGWAVTAAYALAAVSAVMVIRQAPFEPSHRRQMLVLWGLIALLMAALALNKQLDLQALMTALGRCLAQQQGWYEDRRLVQRDFILGLIAVAALAAAGLFWMLRGTVRQNLVPVLALAALAGFVLIRAGHLLHVFIPDEAVTDRRLHDLTSALEMLCPVLILVAAWQLLRMQPMRSRP
jgi:uncharacterized membrane protein YhaH (DUF805 family)